MVHHCTRINLNIFDDIRVISSLKKAMTKFAARSVMYQWSKGKEKKPDPHQ
jgi:hypothetical protein